MLPRAPCYEPEPRPEPLCHQPRCLSTASMQRPVQAIVLTFELLHIRGSSRNSLCSNKKRKTNARYSVVLGGTRWYSAGFGAVLGGTRRYSVVLGGTRWYLKRYPMGFRIKLCLCFEIIDTITIHFAFATSDCNLLHCILRCSTVLIRTTRCGAETLSHVVSRRFAKD